MNASQPFRFLSVLTLASLNLFACGGPTDPIPSNEPIAPDPQTSTGGGSGQSPTSTDQGPTDPGMEDPSTDAPDSTSGGIHPSATPDDDAPDNSGVDPKHPALVPGVSPHPAQPAKFQQQSSSKSRIEEPSISYEEYEQIRKSSNDLGFDLIQRLNPRDNQNLAFSSLSLQSAMSLIEQAASGETQGALQKAMGLNSDRAKNAAAINLFERQLADLEEKPSNCCDELVLRTANHYFVSDEYRLGAHFLDRLAENYGSESYEVPFSKQPEAALRDINGWVAENTKQKIPNLFKSEDIHSNTKWVIANALYLKAPWTYNFNPRSTKNVDFTKLDGTSVPVETMYSRQDKAYYGQEPEFRWGSLALGEKGKLRALFVLPNEGTFKEVESSLNAETMDAFLARGQKVALDVTLPKVTIETGSMDLSPSLSKLGAGAIFGPEADFSAAFDADSEDDLPPLTKVVQSVFIAFAEEGIEAAAATGGVGEEDEPQKVESLRLDRPYLFAIYDSRTNLMLFNGRVVAP